MQAGQYARRLWHDGKQTGTQQGRGAGVAAVQNRGYGRLMRLLGVDGCRGGWVVASADVGLGAVAFSLVAHVEALFATAAGGDALVAIDIPIGLADRGPRACDLAARRLLGPRRGSSVFPAPPRAALAAAGYVEACALARAADGKAISRQLFGILPKIREVDAALTVERQAWVHEAHPEVVFAVLAELPAGALAPKKTAAGADERVALLARQGIVVDPVAIRRTLGHALVARDDVLDAAACLVAAHRLHTGGALSLPLGETPRDARGLRMTILA